MNNIVIFICMTFLNFVLGVGLFLLAFTMWHEKFKVGAVAIAVTAAAGCGLIEYFFVGGLLL